jgi:hypothetical protein
VGGVQAVSYDAYLELDAGGPERVTIQGTAANYTSNVAPMFNRALGRPLRDLDGLRAPEAMGLLVRALDRWNAEPDVYAALNPENGWGDANGARSFLEQLLEACIKYPLAVVRVSC